MNADMRQKTRRALALATTILLLDQFTKFLIVRGIQPGARVDVIPGFFRLVHVRNPGAAMGLFAGYSWALGILALVVLGVIAVFYTRWTGRWWERHLAFGLMIGGIVGNLIDRLARGGVVDFISFYYRSWEYWSFNVADSAICVGVAVYLISTYKRPDPDDDDG